MNDAEVCLDFPNYSLFRADRGLGPDGHPRVGGGVALYLRDDLSGDCLATYDNGVVEMIVVKIHQLDSIIVIMYRPPDTTASELRGALTCLDETLSSLSAPLPSVVLCGDLNLGSTAVKWRRSVDGNLVPSIAGHRDGETSGAMQASMLLDLCQKFGLIQQVEDWKVSQGSCQVNCLTWYLLQMRTLSVMLSWRIILPLLIMQLLLVIPHLKHLASMLCMRRAICVTLAGDMVIWTSTMHSGQRSDKSSMILTGLR